MAIWRMTRKAVLVLRRFDWQLIIHGCEVKIHMDRENLRVTPKFHADVNNKGIKPQNSHPCPGSLNGHVNEQWNGQKGHKWENVWVNKDPSKPLSLDNRTVQWEAQIQCDCLSTVLLLKKWSSLLTQLRSRMVFMVCSCGIQSVSWCYNCFVPRITQLHIHELCPNTDRKKVHLLLHK